MPRFAKGSTSVRHSPGAGEMTAYEAERAARIAANNARMSELGILTHARSLVESATTTRLDARSARANARIGAGKYGRRERNATSAPSDRLTRRSSRLTGVAPADYRECDATLAACDKSVARDLAPPPPRAVEEYTQAHKAALGTARKAWTLFVDGYDGSGNRVYDAVRGKCCHQCRQKTVCKHTSCTHCGLLRGQFCGDCLFMRYGENVDEVEVMGDDWRCPPCRDICNCSFCRTRKGWAPTGSMYRLAIREGYESVAHYLILNNLKDTEKDDSKEEFASDSSEDDGEDDKAIAPSSPEIIDHASSRRTTRATRASRERTPGKAAATKKKSPSLLGVRKRTVMEDDLMLQPTRRKAFAQSGASTSATRSRTLIGRQVVKSFDNVPYRGVVAEYDPAEGYYLVRYSDGDEEEMDGEELSSFLVET